MNKYKITQFISLFIFVFSLYSCNVEPEPINYGKDECEHCRMLISDNRFGAEMVTDKGKIFKYDSIECLVDDALAKNLIADESQTLLVTDFYNPEKLIECKTSSYIHNENIRSPMGLNVSSFSNDADVQKFLSENGGQKISWLEVIEMVKQNRM